MNILLTTALLLAATTVKTEKSIEDELREAEINYLRMTGGKMQDTRRQQGRMVFVNAQKSADAAWLRESAAYFTENLLITIDVENGAFSFPDVKKVGEVTVFVIDDEKYPSLLAAPDQGWAAVNVAALRAGRGAKPQFFKARVAKELTRAVAAIAGGIDSSFPGNPVGPVGKIDDLDKFMDAKLALDVFQRFPKTLEAKGVRPWRSCTYEDACREGWAPQPTNEYQKTIWDDVHSIPAKPMKITFDPATQKGKVTK